MIVYLKSATIIGDLYSLFIACADSKHCQNGAFCTAPLPKTENNDVHNRFHSHLHCFHTVPQHITPVYIPTGRLWKNGKKDAFLNLQG